MANSILGQIANPVLANIPGAIDAGRMTRERMDLNAAKIAKTNQETSSLANIASAQQGVIANLPTNMTPFQRTMSELSVREPETAAKVKDMLGGLKEEALTDLGITYVMAAALPEPEAKKLLKDAKSKVSASPAISASIEDTLKKTGKDFYVDMANDLQLLHKVNILTPENYKERVLKATEGEVVAKKASAGAAVMNAQNKQKEGIFEDALTKDYVAKGMDANQARLQAQRDIKQGNLTPMQEAFEKLTPEQKVAYFSQAKVNIDLSKPEQSIVDEANKVVGAKLGEEVASVYKGASEGISQNQRLDRVTLAISRGAKTGAGAEFILNMKSLGKTFGLPIGDLSEQEVIRKVSNEMALRLRNPDSGLGLTGNTSNKDLDFLKASVVGLGRTKEGNLAIVKAMKRLNKFKIALATEQKRLINLKGGSVPLDLSGKLLDFANSYEMYTDAERKAIEAALPEGVNVGDGILPAVFADEDTSAIPAGLPPGAKHIGTSNGKNVYQTPDGKKFIEE